MNPRVNPNDPKRLKMIRRAYGFTQNEFAKGLNLGRSTYLTFEHGSSQLPQDVRRNVFGLTACDAVPIHASRPPKDAIAHLSQDRVRELQAIAGQGDFWKTLRAQNYRLFHLESNWCGRMFIGARDYGMLTALSYLSLKSISLKFNFAFGVQASQQDTMLLFFSLVAILLIIPVLQAFPFHKIAYHFLKQATFVLGRQAYKFRMDREQLELNVRSD